MCRHARARAGGRGAGALTVLLLAVVGQVAIAQQPYGMVERGAGRFTVAAAPHDATLADALLSAAVARDTFPWLPRPTGPVLIQVAPNRKAFEELVGPSAPEYGAAIAFPRERRIVMQGSTAGSDAGDPIRVLRHELAHLALYEALGDLPPRWFDEGYASVAAGEWGREELLATSVALIWRGVPTLDQLEASFAGGAGRAAAAYALSYRAVVELASLDEARGLGTFFRSWQETGSMELAVRSAFNETLGGFQQLWQQRTRRRYGALALFADFTLTVSVLAVVLLPLYAARRRRDRQRLASMARAEANAERQERESAIEALLASVTTSSPGPDGEGRARGP